MYEHKSGCGSHFTSFYRVHDLLYFEVYNEVRDAITREKEIKAWRQEKKLRLIRDFNSDMRDLSDDFLR